MRAMSPSSSELFSCTDGTALTAALSRRLQALGLADFGYHWLPSTPPTQPLGNIPAELWSTVRDLIPDGFNPILQHATLCDRPLLRSELQTWLRRAPLNGPWLQRMRRCGVLLDAFGYREFCALPVSTEHGPRGVLWLSKRRGDGARIRASLRQHRPELLALGRELHQAVQHRLRHHACTGGTRPTPRPLKLLQVLAADDLTLNEAAAKLHISVSTANQHIAAAKQALGAHTTRYAILAALRHGWIEL